jgi:hypothetical protein
MDEIKEMSIDELDGVAGGSRSDERHNLDNYVVGSVSGLAKGKYLYMQTTPGGSNMSVRYSNGDRIQYHPKLSGGYYLAYNWQADKYGYVQAKYVN